MKQVSIFIAVLFSAFNTIAQVQRTKPVKPQVDSAIVGTATTTSTSFSKSTKKKNRELFKELDLSRTQMKQLKEMRQEAKVKKNVIEDNTKLTDEERKQQLREFKKEQLKKMQQILTPEQLTKLKALKKEEATSQMEMDDIDN
jgi:Spy/CpxP family protein refolding chaperone